MRVIFHFKKIYNFVEKGDTFEIVGMVNLGDIFEDIQSLQKGISIKDEENMPFIRHQFAFVVQLFQLVPELRERFFILK
jgi:hypothetical protein